MKTCAGILLFSVWTLAGCGEPLLVGAAEPLRLPEGIFKQGALPVSEADGPTVTAIEVAGSVVRLGQVGHRFSGRVTDGAYSLALRFAELGTGYWVLPVDGPDPAYPGELTWELQADFAHTLPTGPQPLRFVAIDDHGKAGEARDVTLCLRPDFPDNLNACDPARKPPARVVSLTWNSDADLDLSLRTPDGKVVDAKHPTTAPTTGPSIPASALQSPTIGVFDRDSNASCHIDNARRESVSWQELPSGSFGLYVNLFDACGAQATRFEITVYEREALPGGTWALNASSVVHDGQLVNLQANGGGGPSLFITSLTFP